MAPIRLVLDGSTLDLAQAVAIAEAGGAQVAIAPDARIRVRAARAVIERIIAEDRVVYGVNTGFGRLASERIGRDQLRQLQHNLLVSHAVGCGPSAPPAVVRLMLLLRLNALLQGHSGIREETIELLLAMLQQDLLPVVPEQGSVGASGDLAPLAHLALVLQGDGEAALDGEVMSGGEALFRAGLKPLRLEAKEGLALINGTQFSTAVGLLAVSAAQHLCAVADISCALTLEALAGSVRPFDARIAAVRSHPGHAVVSHNVRRLMHGSGILASHVNCGKVQDQYSVRCAPQVHGAVRDALAHTAAVLAREMNAVTDNPLVFPAEGDVISGGNFHAEPLALPFDYAACAAAELGSISERRVETLVNPDLSGLPPFLAGGTPGVNSGLMIAQVTAAALVSENKALAHPASVDSIPTSANKEDHVSMAPIAARKLRDIVTNTTRVLAIELVAARFGIHFRRPLRSSPALEAALALLEAAVPPPGEDRRFGRDIEAAHALIASGALVRAVEAVAGPLAGP